MVASRHNRWIMRHMHTLAVSVLHRAVLAGAIFLSATPPATGAASEDASLLRALAIVEQEHAGLCPETAGAVRFEAATGMLGAELRTDLASGGSPVEALNRKVFGTLRLHASADLKDPCNLLPSSVLERRQGYCVGIAALYLLLAEGLNLPIHAVSTPSHVFLRYDDGTRRSNIETLQEGADVPDEQYIREQKIPAASIRSGVFMRNLTADEFLAQVHNNLGVVYSERKDYAAAAKEYEAALGLDRRLPAACYNYGNDLLRTGKYRRAKSLFSKSLRLYPADVWALNNRGLAYLKLDKQEKARRDFEAALRIDPGFEQARKNLEAVAP